jgi:hypothetical protein
VRVDKCTLLQYARMREHMLDLPAGTRLDGRSLRQRDQGTDFVKAVILAGGYGTRISEETAHIPKPMIEIFCGTS